MTIAIVMMGPWFAVAGLAAVGLAVWMHLYERVASRRMPVSSLRLVPETPRVARNRRRIALAVVSAARPGGVAAGIGIRPARPSGRRAASGGRAGSGRLRPRPVRQHGHAVPRGPLGLGGGRQTGAKPPRRPASGKPGPVVLFPPAETGGDWSNPSEMRKVVAGLTPSLADGRPFDALRAAAEALARFRSDMPESLEVVGDLQQQGWEEIDTLTLPEELRVHVSQTGPPEATNRSLRCGCAGSTNCAAEWWR